VKGPTKKREKRISTITRLVGAMTSLELQKKLGPKNIKSIEEYFYKVVVLKGLLNL